MEKKELNEELLGTVTGGVDIPEEIMNRQSRLEELAKEQTVVGGSSMDKWELVVEKAETAKESSRDSAVPTVEQSSRNVLIPIIFMPKH